MKFVRSAIKHFNELPAMQYFLVFAASFALFAFFQANRLILDPDTFYHLKIAEMMADSHQAVKSFPWLTATALSRIYVDHHLLYHALLAPFVTLLPAFLGGKVFTATVAACLLTFLYFIFKQEKVELPWFFVFLAASSFNFIFRLNLIKASGLAILILLAGIWALLKGRYWLAAAIGAIYVSVHGGFILYFVAAGLMIAANSFETVLKSPIPPALRSYFGMFKDFLKNCFLGINLKIGLAALGGTALGIAISPYHLKLLPFLQEQLIQIGIFTKLSTVRMGNEWYPYSFSHFFTYNAVALIVFSLALVIFFLNRERRNAKSIFFMLFSVFFLVLTIRSRRFIEYFVPFSLIFSALIMPDIKTWIRMYFKSLAGDWKTQAAGVAFITVLAAAPFAIGFNMIWEMSKSVNFGRDYTHMSGVASWLKANTKPGEVIFHTDWSDFPSMFYWDADNYYLTGLDPTFMYNVSPSLYTMYEDIVRGKTKDNIRQLIEDTFKARIIVLKSDASLFAENLERSGDFQKVYTDKDATIYRSVD